MKTFLDKIYSVTSRIPKGKVATYKQIAQLAGNRKASRAVGTAMRKNPDMTVVPCHRVVGSDGKMHGYSAKKGIPSKVAMLKKEGVIFRADRVDLERSQWKP